MARLSNPDLIGTSDSGRKSKTRSGSTKKRKETAGQGDIDRRRFIRQSAEVAAMSLFGVTALDSVIDRVIRRMTEMQATQRLANDVASHLPKGAAWASEVPAKPELQLHPLDCGCDMCGMYCLNPDVP